VATRSEWGRVSIAGHPIAGAEIEIKKNNILSQIKKK